MNKQYTREKNRGKILQMIATDKCNTRIELHRTMELSKMAVSNIVTELIQSGIVAEKGKEANGENGPNPIRLCIADSAPKVVGLLIFREYCEAVLCGMDLKIIRRERRTMEAVSQENFVMFLYGLLDTLILNEKGIIGIGVASIGPINVNCGMILSPGFFNNIHDIPIVEVLKERYNLPVFFDHDNQSAVLAEKFFGNGREYVDILLIGVSIGVGCGIIADSDLYSNRRGLSPEFGHLSIDFNGPECFCGSRGCLETYIRTPVMLKKLQDATGKHYSYEKFCEIAREDVTADAIFRDAVERMATAIVSGINILNSECILLGYDTVYWSEEYIKLLEGRINERKFSDSQRRTFVKKAYFGRDAQLMGAVCNVLIQIFRGNLFV